MIGLLSGFLSSVIPPAIDLWKDHSDKKQEYKLLELQMMHAEKLKKEEREAGIVEAEANLQATTVRAASRDVAKSSQWVININALVRPIITLLLIGGFLYAAIYKEDLLGTGSALVLATEWCIAYWFGKRCFDKQKRQV